MAGIPPYKMRARVWLYQGKAAWHFVTLPQKQAAHIKSHYGWLRRGRKGWGSIRVEVTVGKTRWETSIFPEKETGSYVLPLKEKVRVLEGLRAGKMAALTLRVREQPDPKTQIEESREEYRKKGGLSLREARKRLEGSG